jgi:hypothetical protein
MPLSKTVRILVVIQLCIGFMMLAWYVCYPFMGELYHWRSRLFLAQNVIGDTQLLDYVSDKDKSNAKMKLESNQQLFSRLPPDQQGEVLRDLNHYKSKTRTTFKQKAASTVDIFLNRLPPLKEAWLIFTFLTCFALLFRIEGAHSAAWSLPVLALAYLISNGNYPSGLSPDAKLYPTEEMLFAKGEEFSKKTLPGAWQNYLEKEWGGEFFFNLARLKEMRGHPSYHSAYLFKYREPLPLLFVYFAWNLIFAYICCKHEARNPCKNQLKTLSGQL